MKNLDSFLSIQEEEKKKPHATKSKEGADDKQYIAIMSQYKNTRKDDRKGSDKMRKKAQDLAKEGDVSNNAKILAAYL